MKLLKDYDCKILYHPGKANKVADLLSQKSAIAQLMVKEWALLENARDLDFKLEVGRHQSLLATLKIEAKIILKVKALQQTDSDIQKIHKHLSEKKKSNFHITKDGILKFNGHLCVPNDEKLKEEIFMEAHKSNYSIHPSNAKMY